VASLGELVPRDNVHIVTIRNGTILMLALCLFAHFQAERTLHEYIF
jgi:hypothetical protein